MELVERTNRQLMEALSPLVAGLPQVDLGLLHFFGHGFYLRMGLIKKGTLIDGKVHRFSNMNIVLKGEMRVMTEQGLVHVVAPCAFVAPPGVKRQGVAIEDTVWVTVIETEITDPVEAEQKLVANSYAELECEVQ